MSPAFRWHHWRHPWSSDGWTRSGLWSGSGLAFRGRCSTDRSGCSACDATFSFPSSGRRFPWFRKRSGGWCRSPMGSTAAWSCAFPAPPSPAGGRGKGRLARGARLAQPLPGGAGGPAGVGAGLIPGGGHPPGAGAPPAAGAEGAAFSPWCDAAAVPFGWLGGWGYAPPGFFAPFGGPPFEAQ